MATGVRTYQISRNELRNALTPQGLFSRVKDALGLDKLPLSARDLISIKEFEEERIFEEGIRSDGQQMPQARWRRDFERRGKLTAGQTRAGRRVTVRGKKILGVTVGKKKTQFEADYASEGEIKRHPYRFRSGELMNSMTVVVRGSKLIISYKSAEGKLQGLEQRFGVFLKPAAQTYDFIAFLIMRNQGTLPPGTREPTPPWRR